ncbi:cytochrome d ubiquinol oxidase subunit II [Candidatus Paracaedibacter symbiosus]|uniref:cytochrome d ubiquinol oxidase subunit II n=1 Tax=Candidatus Paracaedibacter symbiosus TaxID=244582 RepID=UPI000509B6F6|nr:cytochrome d ubiquinol oxidase subunit II [Candidatus Paracaedibacter symbiosus]
MIVPIDYETLRVIWWMILGVLLCGFAIMDGFDLGVAMLLPFVGKTDTDRRVILNTIGPVWEGNQVWFILGGGAIFAAWPFVYAVAFSGFYVAMFLILWALILRPVGFKFRSKLSLPAWRQVWDTCLCISGTVPSLIFGVAVGNVMQGVPFFLDENLRCFYTGSFFDLLGAFPLLCGILSVTMFLQHGALYLSIKTEPEMGSRALSILPLTTLIWLICFSIGGLYAAGQLQGFTLLPGYHVDGASNPLSKEALILTGAWINNYFTYPLLWLVPFSCYVTVISAWYLASLRYLKSAFVLNGLAIATVIITVGISMFPFILPSSIHTSSSLTVWDASSSQLTLFIMLLAVIVFLPIILLYTRWVYKVLAGPVTAESIDKDMNSY